jgi:hypothetical protein
VTVPTPDLRSFIERLTRATEKRTVEWESLEGSVSTFEVRQESGTIRIFSKDQDDQHPYRFVILNTQDQVLAETETTVGSDYADWERELERLYERAKDKALGVRDVLTSLEQELGLEDDLPF